MNTECQNLDPNSPSLILRPSPLVCRQQALGSKRLYLEKNACDEHSVLLSFGILVVAWCDADRTKIVADWHMLLVLLSCCLHEQ